MTGIVFLEDSNLNVTKILKVSTNNTYQRSLGLPAVVTDYGECFLLDSFDSAGAIGALDFGYNVFAVCIWDCFFFLQN